MPTQRLTRYRHADALAQVHAGTPVGRSCKEEALHRTEAPIRRFEAISIVSLDCIFA